MKKLKQAILKYLSEGLSRNRVALAMAAGLAVGIFPIYGPLSLFCIGLAALTRLNAPILLGGYYAMTFIKPLLIVPFLRVGEWIFRADPMGISLLELTRRFTAAPAGTLADFGWSFLHALAGWMVVLPLLLPLLYFVSLALVDRLDAFRPAWVQREAVNANHPSTG